jgi:hypothetical protein
MIFAFALQRLPATERSGLLHRLRAAATDDDLRRGLIRGDLAPALADVRLLATLHLAAARSAADVLARRCADRSQLDMLIDGTGRILDRYAPGGAP